MTLDIVGAEFRGGLDSFVADEHQAFVAVRDVLEKRQADKSKTRDKLNAQTGRGLPRRHTKVRIW